MSFYVWNLDFRIYVKYYSNAAVKKSPKLDTVSEEITIEI